MVRDRITELKGIQSYNSDCENTECSAASAEESDDFEKVEMDTDHKSSFAGPILKKYVDVMNDLKEIQSNVQTLKSMLEGKNAHIFHESEFNTVRQKNVNLGNHLTSKFKKLEAKLPAKNDFRTKARMQRALFYGFFQQYITVWTSHEAMLQKYEQQLKKNLQIQSKILNYELTEEEIDTLIANKQTNMLMDNILADSQNARQQLQELKCRFSELVKLEKSISEVHGLFLRLQTLVVEQGAVMQCIETHFDHARNHISNGLNSIQRIAPNQGTFGLREKIILIILILFVLLFVVSINSFRCVMFCKKK